MHRFGSRYTVLIANRKTGAVRRLTLGRFTVEVISLALCLFALLPLVRREGLFAAGNWVIDTVARNTVIALVLAVMFGAFLLFKLRQYSIRTYAVLEIAFGAVAAWQIFQNWPTETLTGGISIVAAAYVIVQGYMNLSGKRLRK